jgi:predicted RNA polymerase sigma factor
VAGLFRWARIASWYGVLSTLWPSPVVELNRAVAVGMATGPATGLEILDRVRSTHTLTGYPQLAAVRGDLLARLDRAAEARAEFEQAAQLTNNAREWAVFLGRAAQL